MLMEHEWISRMNITNWNMGESKDFLFVINQVKANGHYSGTIIKKSDNDNYILNDKIEYTLSGGVKCDCDIPVYYVHKDNVIVEGEPIISTSEINITRKVDGSQTESVIYANRDWFNTLRGFTKMRIAEYEDEKCYTLQLIYALDFVDFMYRNDKYKKLSRMTRWQTAAEKYGLLYEEVRKGSIRRVNIRTQSKKKWYNNNQHLSNTQ